MRRCAERSRRLVQAALQNSAGAVEVVVADAGYDNNHQIHQLKQIYGVRSIVAVKDPRRLSKAHLQTRRRQRVRKLKIARIMELATPEGRCLMNKRKKLCRGCVWDHQTCKVPRIPYAGPGKCGQ